MKKNILIFLLFIVVLFSGFKTAGAENLTLEQVLELGLENNLEIKNSQLDYKIAENDFEIARRNLFPQVSLETSYTKMEEGPQISSFEIINQPPGIKPVTREGPDENYRTSLSISQPLYAGGRIRLGIDQARQGKKLTQIKKQQQTGEVLHQIIQAFYNVLMAEDRVQIEKDTLKLVQEHKRMAQSSFEAGTAIKTDVLKVEIEESKARQRLLEAKNQLILARQRLGNLIGKASDFSLNHPQQEPEIETDFQKLYQTALAQRPEIKSLEKNQELTRTNLELEQKSFYPSFSLRGNYSQQGSEFAPEEASWSLTISGTMSLYQGGQSGIKQKKIKNQLQQLQQTQENMLQMIKLEVRQKLMALEENRENIKVQKMNLQKAQENLELENKRFKTGVGKSIDVLNAQTTLKQTRIAASQAQYKYEQSLYDMLLKTGRLTDYVKEAFINAE